MLNKREKSVMKIIYYRAVMRSDGVGLLSPIEILRSIPYKYELASDDLNTIIKELALDDYFDYVVTEKKGEQIICFTLHQKGHAFYREILSEKRAVQRKVWFTIAGVIGGFILKEIITAIMN